MTDAWSEIEIAWAAGFLEGEGCFFYYRGDPQVAAYQKAQEPLRELQRIFGGSVKYYVRRRPDGAFPIYDWRVHGANALKVMTAVRAHMSSRRKEKIDEVQAIAATRPGNRWKRKKIE